MLVPQKLDSYIATYQVCWAIVMPDKCPPMDIEVPHDHPFYRLTINPNCIQEQDLKSYAELDPLKDWGERLPLAVGLSLINNELKAYDCLKLPFLRKKHLRGIAKIILHPTEGVVKQSGKQLSHYTWWRTTQFTTENIQMLQL